MFKFTGAQVHASFLPVLSAQLCDMPPITDRSHPNFPLVHFRLKNLAETIDTVDHEIVGDAVNVHSDGLIGYNVSQVRKGIWIFGHASDDTDVDVRVTLGLDSLFDLEISASDAVPEMPMEFMGLAYRIVPNGRIEIETDNPRLESGFRAVAHMSPPELLIKSRNPSLT